MIEKNKQAESWIEKRMYSIYHNFKTDMDCEFEDLVGKNRRKDLVRARGIFTLACLKHGMSYSSIGRFLNRDHTTVMHSAETYRNDSEIKVLIDSRKIENLPLIENISKINYSRTGLNHNIYREIYSRFNAKCAVCGFDEIVEVHHLIPVKQGGSNEIENLVLLCPSHHRLADHGMLIFKDIPKPFTLSTEHSSSY